MKNIYSNISLISCILILSFLASSCGGHAKSSKKSPKLKPGEIKISSTKFFNKETALLSQHLGLVTGATEVEYNGPSLKISKGYEIWHNGVVIKPAQFDVSISNNDRLPAIFSFSLKDISEYTENPKYEIRYGHKGENGSGTSTHVIDKPKLSTSSIGGYLKTINPQTILNNKNGFRFFGYMVGKGSESRSGSESILAAAKRVEWAFVVIIKIDK
jgi:hypothetical protein